MEGVNAEQQRQRQATETEQIIKDDKNDGDRIDDDRADGDADAFDATTSKGRDGGLFRQCMTSIRSSHITANRLRTFLVVAGMFSDISMYSEVIALFYLVTKTMEEKLVELTSSTSSSTSPLTRIASRNINSSSNNNCNIQQQEDDKVATALLSLGYNFTPDYERDLKFLLETKMGIDDWNRYVRTDVLQKNNVVRSYIKHIQQMKSGAEVAGATFCLWGALIIGGGAAAKPRAERLVNQKDSLRLFDSVTGPGRNHRKQEFIRVWDSLIDDVDIAGDDDADGSSRTRNVIVKSCQDCMQLNNHLIASVNKTPWWMKYLYYGVSSSAAVAVAAVLAALGVGLYRSTAH